MTILAHWKETGKWWEGEPEREFRRFLDQKGVVRQMERKHACIAQAAPHTPPTAADLADAVSADYELLKRGARIVREETETFAEGGQKNRASPFVPLHCVSACSFGRSTLSPERIAALACSRGMRAAALADRFSLAAAAAFARACAKAGIKPIIGASVEMETGGELVLLVKSPRGYSNLCRLITRCHLEEPRLFPLCTWERLGVCAEGLICLTGGHNGPINLLLMGDKHEAAQSFIKRLCGVFGNEHVYVEIERCFVPWELSVNRRLLSLAKECEVCAVAGGIITHAGRDDFPSQDALLCAETLCTVEEVIGRKPHRDKSQPQAEPRPLRSMNAERFFRSGEQFENLFSDMPELIVNSREIAERMPDDPFPPRPQFPRFYDEPEAILRYAVMKGASGRYKRLTSKAVQRIEGELDRICELGFASHFLAIWEACRWAKRKGILFSARGSVVDSAVAYCLGLSRIDAIEHDLHFDRFLPEDGSKRPDIDIDFEAARRNEVRDFFVKRYGKEHVAGIAAISTFRGRGIVRMIGKALMIPDDVLGCLAKRLHGSVTGNNLEAAFSARPELRDSGVPIERFRLLFDIARRIDGLPRQMAAHASGLILSATPICETVPLMESGLDRFPMIQWDKYSAKHFFDKFDILCLRGQDVLSGTQYAVRENHPDKLNFDVGRIALDDKEVYAVFQTGDLIGIPQSASPAMRQAHVRLRTENLHDASLVQAGIRPGVGGAVKINALIRRRRGLETYEYPHPLLEKILGKSYGIIVFQEQVDQLLQEFCGYTAGEAEEIRENIYRLRAHDWGRTIHETVVSRCLERGFPSDVAEHVFELVSGFRGYGFAQGHALAFADISIRCVHLLQTYPAEYFAALLSAQPAGYYGPGTIANEARLRGVQILPADVNASGEQFSVENGNIRVGLAQLHGLSQRTMRRVIERRAERPYKSIFDFCERARPPADELEFLILSGALDSLHCNRRALLWAIPDALDAAHAGTGGGKLFREPVGGTVPDNVADFSDYEKAVLDRAMLGLDVRTHLIAFERNTILEGGGITCAEAPRLKPGTKAIVVGLAMRLRFPPTASGRRIVFFDLEDESGLLNVTCFDETYRRDGHAIICSPFVTLRGIAQDRDGHIAFLANRVFPYALTVDKENVAEERGAVHAEDFLDRRGR
ncbi:MAG: DNA polymerase III subunit alpha [Armatimonadetes bacterium]|nr:DNA polymerase III subunit alpha [Armatimonadota bacterium]